MRPGRELRLAPVRLGRDREGSGVTLPPLARPLQRLEREKREIASFLRLRADEEEAEAMASPGYRSVLGGGCGQLACDPCNQEPTEQASPGHRGRSAQRDPRHVQSVISRVDLFPMYLYVGVPREV